MRHNLSTETYEIYCPEHRPFQLDQEEYQSFWERIDSTI